MLRFASSTAAVDGLDQQAAAGPFAHYARDAWAAGLVVVPTAADDAKQPLVRWGRLRNQPRLSTLDGWAEKFPGANLAYLPEPSGLLVVDVDDMTDEDRIRARLGLKNTPIIIRSGRRGLHFPLRIDQPVPSLDLRPFGLVGEIKSARAIVVAPGSIHPVTGRRYDFLQGHWHDFVRLPTFDVGMLEAVTGRRLDQAEEMPRSPQRQPNVQGHRNASTFDHLRQLGAMGMFSSESEVIEAGLDYNAQHNEPPEPEGKVKATARQVWRYIERGTCRAKRSGFGGLTAWQLARLRSLGRGYADALALFLELKRAHTARTLRGETFAIAATAMASELVVPGWGDAKRYLRAKQSLIECGLIVLVEGHRLHAWVGNDGKKRWRGKAPAQFRFGVEEP